MEALNDVLPAQIRIWSCVRVTNAFNAKTACSGRVYEYLCPTYVFQSASGAELDGYLDTLDKDGPNQKDSDRDILKTEESSPVDISALLSTEIKDSDSSKSHNPISSSTVLVDRKFRLPSSTLLKIREIIALYLGSHNFHNFTVGRSYVDQSATRHITGFDVGHDSATYNS